MMYPNPKKSWHISRPSIWYGIFSLINSVAGFNPGIGDTNILFHSECFLMYVQSNSVITNSVITNSVITNSVITNSWI